MSLVEVVRHADAAALARAAAARLITGIVELAQAGPASVVLTGGGIGTAVLAEASRADWSAVDVWWGDDRYLPAGDPERNETSARRVLLDRVVARSVHPMPASRPGQTAEQAAAAYAEEVRAGTAERSAAGLPIFDILMLGIGEDGHVASLFPELPAVHVQSSTVIAVHGAPKPPPTRITMSLPMICEAQEVWLLAAGSAKAEAVRLALEPGAGPLQVPASGARGRERTLLLVDEAAAAKLPAELGRR